MTSETMTTQPRLVRSDWRCPDATSRRRRTRRPASGFERMNVNTNKPQPQESRNRKAST